MSEREKLRIWKEDVRSGRNHVSDEVARSGNVELIR